MRVKNLSRKDKKGTSSLLAAVDRLRTEGKLLDLKLTYESVVLVTCHKLEFAPFSDYFESALKGMNLTANLCSDSIQLRILTGMTLLIEAARRLFHVRLLVDKLEMLRPTLQGVRPCEVTLTMYPSLGSSLLYAIVQRIRSETKFTDAKICTGCSNSSPDTASILPFHRLVLALLSSYLEDLLCTSNTINYATMMLPLRDRLRLLASPTVAQALITSVVVTFLIVNFVITSVAAVAVTAAAIARLSQRHTRRRRCKISDSTSHVLLKPSSCDQSMIGHSVTSRPHDPFPFPIDEDLLDVHYPLSVVLELDEGDNRYSSGFESDSYEYESLPSCSRDLARSNSVRHRLADQPTMNNSLNSDDESGSSHLTEADEDKDNESESQESSNDRACYSAGHSRPSIVEEPWCCPLCQFRTTGVKKLRRHVLQVGRSLLLLALAL
ncbi:unnamed protein product [Soboliphyme baturini]|uniref:BTB domain-containing protein n=1 Tax=Soboliphyme baturini TaxID=241478 RepID=A0A183IR72_9BILA|nr:unnamed protein product [Soboliphyme baturini]